MPRHSRQASSPATNASSSTTGSSPPAAFTAASTPPPVRGAGSSSSAGSSAGSPEQVPADRELQYLCPRTGCNTNLFLKGNNRKDRADYPACRNLSAGTCAWTGLLIKYPGKVCWLCASEFEVGEVVWAYTIPDVERPACYISWCLNAEACIVLKEDGVPVDVRPARTTLASAAVTTNVPTRPCWTRTSKSPSPPSPSTWALTSSANPFHLLRPMIHAMFFTGASTTELCILIHD
ncbi:unnamed protein product [Ectocarpus sp. 13 AM-2016]